MDPPRKRLLSKLGVLELCFTTFELAAIIVPLTRFFPMVRGHAELPWLLAALVVGWSAVVWWWLAPLRRPVSPEDQELADEICRRIRRVPGRMMVLRLVLWVLVGLSASLLLINRGALSSGQAITALTICVGHSFVVAVIRLAVLMPLLRNALRQLGLRGGWLEEQAETLFDQLTEVALVVGAASAVCSLLFIYLFVPMTQEQFLRLETYFPPAGTALGFVWYFAVAPRQLRPLATVLRQAASRKLSPDELTRACTNGNRLPTTLALTKVGFFSTAAVVMFVESVWLGFSVIQATFLSLAIFLVAVGFGIYEFIWSHSLLRPVLARLIDRHAGEAGPPAIRGRPLSRKLLVSLGGAIVFAISLALFWAYLLHGNLRANLAVAQAERELRTALTTLAVESADEAQLARRVAELRPIVGSRYLRIGPTSPAGTLPDDVIKTVRRQPSGTLELDDRGVAGAYRRLDRHRPELGSLLALVPMASSSRPALGVGSLVVFFGVVLALGLGLVLATSGSLTRPLAELEQAAFEMAAGKLDRPVRSVGGFDEIGSLTAAFEGMRRRLKEKIHAVEQLNVTLEEKVRERTAELNSSNEELRATLDALTNAQQQLLVSERMAAVGQLVAGVAHEINNPINAVSNMIDPLAATVEDLVQAAGEGKVDEALEADLAKILAVLRSGTSRTKTIVSALRNYARGDIEEPREIDLHGDIEESLTLLGHRMRDLTLDKQLAAEGPLVALRGRLNQALLNLLANAADAVSGVDEARVCLRTRGAADAEQVVIEIEDNGPGIPAELQARVFDPFFTTKDVGEGTGLGLSISHRIAEEHGGRLELSSEPGRTIFTLTLPRRPI